VRILVCGSRSWTDAAAIRRRLRAFPGAVVVSGAARGADSLAAQEAYRMGLAVELHPADWQRDGRRAGFLRNLAMLDSGVDLVLAFWDGSSRGTAHTMAEARRRGIPVEVYGPQNV
jgi:hypothetical protein